MRCWCDPLFGARCWRLVGAWRSCWAPANGAVVCQEEEEDGPEGWDGPRMATKEHTRCSGGSCVEGS